MKCPDCGNENLLFLALRDCEPDPWRGASYNLEEAKDMVSFDTRYGIRMEGFIQALCVDCLWSGDAE